MRVNASVLNMESLAGSLLVNYVHVTHVGSVRIMIFSGHTQPPIQWVSGTLSLRGKRPGREVYHSPPSSAEVKNACVYIYIYTHWGMDIYPSPSTPSWCGAQLTGCLDYLGFESRQGLGIFLFATASRPALWTTQAPTQWILWVISLGVKRQGREAYHSLPSSSEVKTAWR